MAFHRKEPKEQAPAEKIIEISAQMEGQLVFPDPVNLRINGHFTGRLDSKGTLTVGNTAHVEADITGENVVIAGRVKGNVIAKKMLVLMPSAVLNGDISTAKLSIVEGAIFQGRCQMFDDFMTVEDLAQYLEIDNNAIIELATEGKIPAYKDGDIWKFERNKIEQWASAGKVR